DDVPFEVTFEFKANPISSHAWLKDPGGTRFPTTCRVGVSVPQSHDIPAQMPMSEQRELLQGYELRVKPVEGKEAIFPYSKSLPGIGMRAKFVEIVGPVYGSRKITIKATATARAPIIPWIYQGFAPWQGFFVGLYKDDPDARVAAQRIVLTID
ncbi:MAG: hypothetical protein PHR35_13420, partial [Kiritimatiellae bacterium]|nr:hypothetical protein [Kiritimatiellia bacterium]